MRSINNIFKAIGIGALACAPFVVATKYPSFNEGVIDKLCKIENSIVSITEEYNQFWENDPYRRYEGLNAITRDEKGGRE